MRTHSHSSITLTLVMVYIYPRHPQRYQMQRTAQQVRRLVIGPGDSGDDLARSVPLDTGLMQLGQNVVTMRHMLAACETHTEEVRRRWSAKHGCASRVQVHLLLFFETTM